MNSPTQISPEFEAQCREVMAAWQTGNLPINDAITQITALLHDAANADHKPNQGRAHIYIGILQGYRSYYPEAIAHLSAANDVFHPLQDNKQLSTIDVNLGEVYRHMGDYTRARQYFRAAHEVAETLNDKHKYTQAIINEGLMLINMGYWDGARGNLDKAQRLLSALDEATVDIAGMACEIERGMALIELHHDAPEAAWPWARQSFLNAQRSGKTIMLGYACRVCGEALAALPTPPDELPDELPDKPDACFRDAIRYFQEVNAEGEVGRTMYKHALSLLAKGDEMAATRKLQYAMKVFIKRQMTTDAAKAASAQSLQG